MRFVLHAWLDTMPLHRMKQFILGVRKSPPILGVVSCCMVRCARELIARDRRVSEGFDTRWGA